MMTNIPPDPRDPAGFDPLNPAAPDPRDDDPRVINNVDARPAGGNRAGLAIAAVLAALLVIGFIAFSGPGGDVDHNTTASPGTPQSETMQPTTPMAPPADQTAPAPGVAPAEPNDPAAPAPAQ